MVSSQPRPQFVTPRTVPLQERACEAQDLDLAAGTILVRRIWSRQRLGPTKTGHERRVRITHPVADDSAEWRPGSSSVAAAVLAGLQQLTIRPLDDAEAFIFDRGRAPLSSMELHRSWRRALVAVRVRDRPPEQLCHTFASTLLSRNAPLLYVQGQGGWRSAGVLLRVYARWMPEAFPEGLQELPTETPAQPGTTTGAISGGARAR